MARDFDQACSNRGTQRLKRKTDGFVLDDSTFHHQRFACGKATLAIFVIDQRQPALIGRGGLVAAAGKIWIDDLANAVG